MRARRLTLLAAVVVAAAGAASPAPAGAASVATTHIWQDASAWWSGGSPFSVHLLPVGAPCGVGGRSCPYGSLEDQNQPLDWTISGGVRRACDSTWGQILRYAKQGDTATYTISPDQSYATVAISGRATSCGVVHRYTFTAELRSTAPLMYEPGVTCYNTRREMTAGSSVFRWDNGVTTTRGAPDAGDFAVYTCLI